MLATEPLAGAAVPVPHYARHGFDYWQQTPDGRLLAGGFRDRPRAEFTARGDDAADPGRARATSSSDCSAAGPESTHRWAGIFGLVPDLLPLVGRVPGRDGVWVAGGYSGHGNVLGFVCGELVARAIAGDRIRCSTHDPRGSSPSDLADDPATAIERS